MRVLERPSSVAMSSLERPRVMELSTSICRFVNSGSSDASSSVWRISGENFPMPTAVLRMASVSSALERFFVTAPVAPAAIARAMSVDVPNVVRIITFDSGEAFSTAAVVSAPSMSGIMRSMTIKLEYDAAEKKAAKAVADAAAAEAVEAPAEVAEETAAPADAE